MKSNNVIIFPNSTAHISVEDVKEQARINKEKAIEEVVDNVMIGLLSSLNTFSVEINDPKDVGLICESIKSAIYRSQKMDHALQNVADNTIRILD